MPVWALVFVLALALLAVAAAGRVVLAWWKLRGDRVVNCPENQRAAGVRLNAVRTALTVFGKPDFRLSECSRWPERAGCGQECLSQIHDAPEDCLVRNILTRWYAGKSCANCGQPIGAVEWAGAKPAFLLADKITVDWSRVPAERLHETLSAALPVCFACHMANTLVREHPSIVLDRTRAK